MPLPVSMLSDRISPQRVIILAWILALIDSAVIVLASNPGFILVPDFLEDVHSFSQARVGILSSVSFFGDSGF